MSFLRSIRKRISLAREMTDLDSIVRRYFVIGAFDGALTILGVVLGASAAGELTRNLVLYAGVSGGIALGISSMVGAYEAERVERGLSLMRIKRSLLNDVGEEYQSVVNMATSIGAVIHGIAPIVAAFVPLAPFLLLDDMRMAMILSVLITMSFLFTMGVYIAKPLKDRIIYTGLRFVTAGLATALLVYLLTGGHT